MLRMKISRMLQRTRPGGWGVPTGAAVAGVVLLAMMAPGVAGAQCGPGTANTPCVYYHSSTSATTGSTPATTLSFSFTVPPNTGTTSCTNGFLTVPIAIMNNGGNAPSVSSVTYGGTAMTVQAATTGNSDPTNDNSRKRVEMWTLGTPTPGTANVVITLPSAAQIVAGAVMACGVDQTTPFIGRTFGNNQGANNLAQVGVSSSQYALLLDIIATDANVTASVSNSETNTFNVTSGTLASNVRGSSSHKSSSSTFEISTYNLGANTYWALGALTLRPWAPTSIGLESFDAESYDGGTVLRWHTGHEANTLGFQVYREVDGKMVPVNRDVIVASGLSFSGPVLQAGYTYSWFDPQGRPGDVYWLKDMEIGGEGAWHGPFTAQPGHGRAPRVARSRMLGEVSRALSLSRRGAAVPLRGYRGVPAPLAPATLQGVGIRRAHHGVSRVTAGGRDVQWRLAAAGAAKIEVSAPGWYRVSFQALEAAGFAIDDPVRLHLYADGVEQAIRVDDAGSSGNRPESSYIEFFGVPNDTPASGTRTYWLVEGDGPGLRLAERDAAGGGEASVATVPFTVEVKERLIYVPGVLNGDRENFFGQAITADPAVEQMTVDHQAGGDATLRLALQGLTKDPFAVRVDVNGATVGKVEVPGATWSEATLTVPSSLLKEGSNTVTLSRMDEAGVAFVDTVDLTYPRRTVVDGGQIAFRFPEEMAGHQVRLDGFSTSDVRVIDVSVPSRPVELKAAGGREGSGYYADVVVPAHDGGTTLLALGGGQEAAPARVALDTPSSWHTAAHRADMVIIGPGGFLPAADPLRAFHESEGLEVAMVDVQDIFDEFSYGAKDPAAIRAFLARAQNVWPNGPRYVLLLGDGSYDPRDYLGFGEDLVPTKLIDTDSYETASDDWFADFDNDGIPAMSIGRLPVDSAEEAAKVVQKIVNGESAGVTLGSMLTVADQAKGDNFALINQKMTKLLPAQTAVQVVNEDDTGADAARNMVLDAIRQGVDFVAYSGHGTVDRWRGDVLTAEDVPTLGNGDHLAVFTMMNCLNGLFQEPLLESLGEALVREPAAGAVAVWASTAATTSSQQELLMDAFYRNLARQPGARIGEAATMAKHATEDLNVRRTWVLLGDPAMKVEGAQ